MTLLFTKDAKKHAYNGTEDFWYALFDGGHIKPEKLLADPEQLKKVRDAMGTLKWFKESMERNGLYEPS